MNLKNFTTTRFWTRLGQPNIIGHNLLFVSVIAVGILSFAFDSVRLQNYTVMWIPLNVASAAIVLAVAIPILLLKRSINLLGKNQAVFNLLFAGLCLAFKNVLMLLLAPLFGIEDSGFPAVRFFGGFVIGIALVILFSNVVGTRLARVNTLKELRSIEIELRQFREAVFEELEDTNRIAAQNAAATLIPQLETLMKLVTNSPNLLDSADRLSKFVTEEIKPFGEKLALEASMLARGSEVVSTDDHAKEEIRITPSKSIRVWISFLPIPFSFFLLSTFTIPLLTPLEAVLAALVFAASLGLCKLALLKAKDLSISKAFASITVVAYLSSIPSYLLLCGVPSTGGVPDLMPTFLIVPAWSVLASSMAYILDQWQSTTETQLTLRIQELARENKLYEQKAWLARHGWYLLLHGVVQPAVTTASIRAASAQKMTPEIAGQIQDDLQRALDALEQSNPTKVELAEGIFNIQQLWQGICDIQMDVSDSVFELTNQRATAAHVLNEVLKEVVSNAVRHGQANKAVIKMRLDANGDITIVAANDGKKPLGNVVESLGSRMLDAVCVDRSLLWNEETQYTEFTATIPVDQN